MQGLTTVQRVPRRWVIPRLGVLDVAAFIAPLLQFVSIDLVGQLYLTDLFLTALLPILLFRYGRRLSRRLPRKAIILLILWLLAQVVTDLIRGSAPNDYLRGWAMIAFTLSNFCTLYLLMVGKRRRLVLFAVGAALGQIASYVLAPSDYALADHWKFGYGDSVSWLLVLVAVGLAKGRRFAWFWSAAILMLVALLNIFMGFRSAGGVAFLASFYVAAQAFTGLRSASMHIRLRQMVMFGIIAVVGAWSVLQVYQYSAQEGWLGKSAQQKYEAQDTGKYGLIIGGRSEILVSSRAILNSPVIGYGSWAKDCRYASMYAELKQEAGYAPQGEGEQDSCLIPTHSALFGAWVQAGILGAMFWVWGLTLPVRALTQLYAARERLSPLVALFAFLMIWNILFSPFGGEQRFLMPFSMVLMMNYLPAESKRLSPYSSYSVRPTVRRSEG